MHISILIGSPRRKESNSSYLLSYLHSLLKEKASIEQFHFYNYNPDKIDYEKICNNDVIILGFPLYIDSIPSHFLRVLIALEEYMRLHSTKSPLIYCVIVNGFYEGLQTQPAIEQVQHWCKRANATFAQAIGYGSGDMLGMTKDIPMGHGTNTMIGKALQKMADNILNGHTGEIIYGSPNFPRIGWKLMAHELFFYSQAKKNGLKRKDLKQLPMNVKEL